VSGIPGSQESPVPLIQEILEPLLSQDIGESRVPGVQDIRDFQIPGILDTKESPIPGVPDTRESFFDCLLFF